MQNARLFFGPFVLDAQDASLTHDGVRIALSPKDCALLHYFATHRGELIPHATLLDAVWPNTVVSPEVLKVRVGRLRRLLGDDAKEPRFIANVHGEGYRFVADSQRALQGAQSAPLARQQSLSREIADPAHAHSAAEHTAAFVLIAGPAQWPLRPGRNMIGRSQPDDSPFNSETVSRRHACIVVNGGVAAIEDLSSKNGTFVNGIRVIGSVPLHDGDIVRLGTVDVAFCSDAAEGQTESAPEP